MSRREKTLHFARILPVHLNAASTQSEVHSWNLLWHLEVCSQFPEQHERQSDLGQARSSGTASPLPLHKVPPKKVRFDETMLKGRDDYVTSDFRLVKEKATSLAKDSIPLESRKLVKNVRKMRSGYDSLAVGVNSRNSEMHVFAGLRGRRLLLQAGSPTDLPCAHPTKVIRFSPLCPKGSSQTVLQCAH
jgi:hypothetical protein